ncbi:SGNH/GDSL hydrolase family protein [Roseateles sp. BYS87W]|uniref:SGNH/GDSL hydrolase family protein n=1 Tax=Pelomonas baiyunensis TaxID=3299026 RepID=A0ABW7GTJ1_9BURK
MIAKLLLGPLLLWQGRRVRATALRLPEAAGPRAAEGDALRVLIVGDSSAAGVGARHQDQALAGCLAQALRRRLGRPVGWQLVAASGHGTREAHAQLASAVLQPADVLVTALGVNDVVEQVPARQALADLHALHQQAVDRAGVQFTVHCAAPPMQHFPLLPQPLRWFFGREAARYNAALQAAVAGQPRRVVLPLPAALQQDAARWMAEDGFHPGPRGYALWAEAVADQVVMGLGLPSLSMAT